MSDIVTKGVDPKGSVGAAKVPLFLVPPSTNFYIAAALSDGAAKYGQYNWRSTNVLASTYISAMKRHIDAWVDGEDFSRDSDVHHLAHALAGCAILLDALTVGTLVDDRPPSGLAADLQENYYNDNIKRERTAGV